MPCHHTWSQKGKDVISVVNGLETTKFTHECPHCGRVKVTVRASRKLPPEIRWKREMEKLAERAWDEGYRFSYDGTPLLTEKLTIEKHEQGKTN